MKGFADKPRQARLRRLSDEEIELWVAVAKSVARRKGASLPTPQVRPPAREAAPQKTAASVAPSRSEPKRASAPSLEPLDKRLKKDLARGRSAVDSAIDLHGMNQAEAHSALRGFLLSAHRLGARLVIVITGKGAPKGAISQPLWAEEAGVLRRQVPHWLSAPDLRAIVLGFEEAGRTHGGAGALYVRLRRQDRR